VQSIASKDCVVAAEVDVARMAKWGEAATATVRHFGAGCEAVEGHDEVEGICWVVM
jgi:hypothetical protein